MATLRVTIRSHAHPDYCMGIADNVVKAVSTQENEYTQHWRKLETNGLCAFQNDSNGLYMCPDESTPHPNEVTCSGNKFQWSIQGKTIHSSTELSKAIKMAAKNDPVKLVTYDPEASLNFQWDIEEV